MTAASAPAFTFIDLFAGIGGFHAVLAGMGGECRYAVEIDKAASAVYALNWGMNPLGDIMEDANDETMSVPPHDVLAAGFPCQPFSKSGAQRGMEETRGTLYWYILRIIQARHPKVVILENVRNLAGPRHAHEWQVIVETLRAEGYRVSDTPAVFSPHQIPRELGGRPQVRERVFITATLDADATDLGFSVDPVVTPKTSFAGFDPTDWDLAADLPLDDSEIPPGCELSASETYWIDAWDEWVQLMWEAREGRRLPGFPVWADEWRTTDELYESGVLADLPPWKRDFFIKNAALYTAHQELCDTWARKWGVYTDKFPPSRRKLEWQAQDTPRLWDTVMHFRPSGIRAKRPTYLPALVAITQTSIIGPMRRRLSPREAARLQGLPDNFDFGGQRDAATYRQLGNGVNIGAVWNVLKAHVERDEDLLLKTPEGERILRAVRSAPTNPDAPVADALQAAKENQTSADRIAQAVALANVGA